MRSRILYSENISFEIVDECSHFENKIFESITLLLFHPCKFKFFVTNLYLPTVHSPISLKLNKKQDSMPFLRVFFLNFCKKTNIDLLNAQPNSPAHEYLNTIMSYGFVQTVVKATRMQGDSYSLIDHILTNCTNPLFTTGSIISTWTR